MTDAERVLNLPLHIRQAIQRRVSVNHESQRSLAKRYEVPLQTVRAVIYAMHGCDPRPNLARLRTLTPKVARPKSAPSKSEPEPDEWNRVIRPGWKKHGEVVPMGRSK